MNQFVKILITLLLILLTIESIDAQRSRRSSRRDRYEEKSSLKDNLGYAFSLGNFSFGSGFFISGKVQGAYKFENIVSVGAQAKFFYNFVNRFGGSDFSLFDSGIGPLVRLHITDGFFLQGEYSYTSFQFTPDNAGNKLRESFFYPLFGAGYKSGNRDWTYGLHVLFVADEEVRDFHDSVEYWIDFNYRF